MPVVPVFWVVTVITPLPPTAMLVTKLVAPGNE